MPGRVLLRGSYAGITRIRFEGPGGYTPISAGMRQLPIQLFFYYSPQPAALSRVTSQSMEPHTKSGAFYLNAPLLELLAGLEPATY